jgi:hypothetical protein
MGATPAVKWLCDIRPASGFSDVSAAVEARSGKRVAWNRGIELDTQAADEVQALLADTLSADEAV